MKPKLILSALGASVEIPVQAKAPERRAQRAHQAQVSDWYRISAKAESSAAKVYIYDAIGGWFGIDAAQLVRDIAALDVDEIELHLNSPGGSVFDGMAIYNALRQHRATVSAVVDGLAASMASIIALAGDTVTMSRGSFLMIHDASGICLGNAGDMTEMAAILDKLSGSMAAIYAQKTGKTVDEMRDVMRAETWYTAAEAVTAGLADSVDGEADKEATARFDLSIFAHVPASFTGQTAAPHRPAEPAESHPSMEGADMTSDNLISGLRERLGVSAELDEDGILAALDEALAEQAESTPAVLPEGTVAISQSVLDELQAKAVRGDEARAQQFADQRDGLVQAALADGRIKPTDVADWQSQLTAQDGSVNPVAAKLLASLAKNTAVPVAPKGYTGGLEDSNEDDALFYAAFPTEKKKEA